MSLCDACITGVRHEGTPTGRIEKLGGVDVYIAIPEGEYSKEKALLYLPDALGLPLVNAQLLADDFAKNGFQVYLVDYFNGDPLPIENVDIKNMINPDSKFDLQEWIRRHDAGVTRPPLNAVIAALRARGIKEFGATGYCFGGKYVFNLAQENVIKVGIASHPSLLQFPEDIEKLLAESKAPILINSCEVDSQFPEEACVLADKLLGDGKYTPGYKRAYWEGCIHGFSVRGDMSDPKIKAGKEGAFKEAVAWLKTYM